MASNLANENIEIDVSETCWNNFLHLADAYDEALENIEGSTKADIKDYIDNSAYKGLLSVYSSQDGDNIEMLEKPAIIILHDLKKRYAKVLDYWSTYLLPVIQELQHEVKFLVCDLKESQLQICEIRHYSSYWNYSQYYRFMCVEASPRVFALDIGKHLHEMPEYCSCENFKKFVIKTARNELFKSEPIPSEDNDQLIKTAVGESFQELVMHSQQDVFLQIYNSHINDITYNSAVLLHLTKIANIFSDEDITFIKVDAHKNTIPSPFNGCRSYFIPKMKREKPLMFHNIFCTKGFINFISANSSDELRGFNRRGKRKLY